MAANISPKVVSERLGHAKVGITLDIYSHVMRNATDTIGINQGFQGEDASTPDQRIVSSDRRFQAVFQGDGNFVVYQNGVGAIWSADRCGQTEFGSGFKAHMQDDGNFVVYRPAGGAVWATSYPQTQPSCPSDQQTVFGAGASPGVFMRMQSDGNLVTYKPGHGAVWSSGTGGR